jgi:hypothetical protein
MSYILHSSIARAGGIDLLLGSAAVSHAPYHPRRRRRAGPGRLTRLRRASGYGLIVLGNAVTRWGKRWAPTAATDPTGHPLTLATQ